LLLCCVVAFFGSSFGGLPSLLRTRKFGVFGSSFCLFFVRVERRLLVFCLCTLFVREYNLYSCLFLWLLRLLLISTLHSLPTLRLLNATTTTTWVNLQIQNKQKFTCRLRNFFAIEKKTAKNSSMPKINSKFGN